MPSRRGITNQQWQDCARCGFPFPIGQLQLQKGLLLDAKCIDNLDVELRSKVIAEILSDTTETTSELEQVYDDPMNLEL